MSLHELPTRQQVLQLLKMRGGMTVKQLSKALEITPMGVRQHLDGLSKANLVTFEWLREGRGRPSQVFHLSEEGDELFPRSYGQLAIALLEEIHGIGGSELVKRVFEGRQKKAREKYADRLRDAGSLEERIALLADLRSEEGYLPEWEQLGPHSYRFVQHNCPLQMVSDKYGVPCGCEKELLQLALGDNVEIVREDHIASGDRQCSYVIRSL